MLPFFEYKSQIVQSRRSLEHFTFPLHLHISVEFVYVHSGTLVIECPGKRFQLDEGDFALISPYTIHGYSSVSDTVDYSLAIANHDTYSDFNDLLLQLHPENPVVKSEVLPKDIPALMEELVSLNDNSKQKPLIKAIVSLILARTLPLVNLKPNSETYNSTLAYKALTYISDHFNEEISLDTMATFLGIGTHSVSRLFSSTIKMSFVKYVNFVRIEYAKKLLDTTNDSILDIAYECGYDTVRTFNRAFKEYTGTTPLNYRKRKL